ncbi:DUF3048 domain-containing protein [Nocardioides gansuensis]|uniref:DUF3048 domain-containing protein n=1 Tax=Nocardioides gansuensis TaxID=2138300 RepID=UPI0014028A19|nr:DUF3048 domain-containing protein [Nocardioides gansuensis]
MHASVRLRAASLATAVALLLAGCSGGDDATGDNASPSQEGSGEASESAPAEPLTWPFTGLPVKGDLPKNGALVAKIDNTSSSAPQVGLGSADLVVEELVEGGMTRLAVFFYSRLPQEVGPVRSMRASDIGIVPDGATVVTSGAAAVTLGRVKGAGIPWVTEGAPGVYRASGRYAPYNLFADLADIGTRARKTQPKPYLDFGTADDLPKGAKVTSLEAFFGGHTTSWRFEGGRYVNTNSYAGEGDRFPTDTVLVLRVQVGDAGYRDPSGAFVPETKFEGKGEALLFHGGRLVRGTWQKQGLKGPIELRTRQGELKVPAGHTWIELVPAQSGNVTWAK